MSTLCLQLLNFLSAQTLLLDMLHADGTLQPQMPERLATSMYNYPEFDKRCATFF